MSNLHSNKLTDIAPHSTGQNNAISGKKSHDTRQHFKSKNLLYGSMLLSDAVQHRSADPKFADAPEVYEQGVAAMSVVIDDSIVSG